MLKHVSDEQLTIARKLLAGMALNPPLRSRSPFASIVLRNQAKIIGLRAGGKSWEDVNVALFGADAPALRTLKRLVAQYGIDKDAPKIRAKRRTKQRAR
jgi:hypothetical protein